MSKATYLFAIPAALILSLSCQSLHTRYVREDVWPEAQAWNVACGTPYFQRADDAIIRVLPVEAMCDAGTPASTCLGRGCAIFMCPEYIGSKYESGIIAHELGHILGGDHYEGDAGVLRIPQNVSSPTQEDCDEVSQPKIRPTHPDGWQP